MRLLCWRVYDRYMTTAVPAPAHARTSLIGGTPRPRLAHAIKVERLTKNFRVSNRTEGLKAALRGMVRREHRVVEAVTDVTFSVEPGEIVGFLGSNGAGKTTTLKMLCGLLHPSGGCTEVLGFEPYRRQREFLRQISLVMGQRNQLKSDLPALDSFDINRAVYGIPRAQFLAARDEIVEILELGAIVTKPVRSLSLGERMKCEIAAALLHRPKVLFLDEPTIGLDVAMQRRIRDFIAEYNRRHGATVILTSHYMADVEALCRRVLLIDDGRLLYDGQLADLVERSAPDRIVRLQFEESPPEGLDRFGTVVSLDAHSADLRMPRDEVTTRVAALLDGRGVTDLAISQPSIEDIVVQVFATAAMHTYG